ncbi:unnamed protein product [Parascedosporium putredinis]|uniref:Uncharacterized protein n=1 Tax=Parascedosporium putredinis TaxID=1442378 RepID=A0A9P1H3X7_9PEZI|nr:unnamed protein product [Parascedosporium putredinis]CAI7996112.1 unnamed protein product [Parascedosporium putredinis]
MRRPGEDDSESVFDREAAGKIPESSEPSSPITTHESHPVARKPTPAAPPPRRKRPESVIQDRHGSASTAATHTVPELRRKNSAESTRSRSESIRSIAPAPPPSRRPTVSHRPTGSNVSLSTQPFPSPPLPSPHIAMLDATHYPTSPQPIASPSSVGGMSGTKVAPPPPPTRAASTRRQSSTSSIEAVSRRTTPVPPPPPRRTRGGSRGSVDLAPSNVRVVSGGEGARSPHAPVETLQEVDEGFGAATADAPAPPDDGQAGAILADLDALQREVEALQQQYASAHGGK